MAQYNGNYTDENGQPVEGADVYVYAGEGQAAVLFDVHDNPITHPVTTDQDGNFAYRTADGFYQHHTWFGRRRVRIENYVEVGTAITDVAEAAVAAVQDELDDEVAAAQAAAATATTKAAEAAASAAAAQAANTFRVSIAFALYADLAAVTGTAGQSAGVFADTGTHTDPVVGGTVNNSGVYSYVEGSGWQRVGELTLNRPDCIEVTQGPYFFGKVGNTRKRMTSGSAIGVTLPQDSDLNVPIGGFIEIEQAGAGTITVAAGSGATLQSRGSLVASNGQYAVMKATKIAANTWNLSGDRA